MNRRFLESRPHRRERIGAGALKCLLALLLAQFGLFPAFVSAQATEGSILGSVRDSSGAAVLGAAVTVTNVRTNAIRKSESNESGEYVVTNLPVGFYTVSAEKT